MFLQIMTSISTKSTLLKIVNQYINNKQLARRHERSNDTMTVRHSLVYGQAKERVRREKKIATNRQRQPTQKAI